MSKIHKLGREMMTDLYCAEAKSFEQTVDEIEIRITEYSSEKLEFDLINVDCSIANALRRILSSEVPTMAVRDIFLKENESVFPDEFIAHRLGLVPLEVDPEMFEFAGEELDERNSLRFTLDVRNESEGVLNVYSDDIRWNPVGSQREIFRDVKFSSRVLMFRLARGQKISAELVCTKNVGKVHAKWSPVCPATYRLMPLIEIGDIFDEDAYKLQKCFSEGVIDVRPSDGRMKAYVSNPRLDSMSREALRHEEFKDKIFIGRRSDYFLFTINTVFLDPLYLLEKAVSVLIEKSRALRCEAEGLLGQ
ncbi:DNA-DIRECTED RNA POLYMERASE I [Encephalitozoon cuniculi GB-M1]|uniref:DNA-DIRECTED RNA POLYMERASE I n=2 Tax=Encephalitozoon cuniculi TaxID=6035 RepID=Q8SSL9_ENCCU|nr:DNA-directed RNA polymerase core subunit RPC40 [Encephalitozoon cuniculi GB-M1]AGE96054.1 DNA-directed RNA polymerase I [Encephalitozoon cuniculi]KMV66714.1 DNA-directed RNA polymerase I [Encephalitozoon cuniculi EcunIII-L]CAD24930.1 DNA-DIRECTED RNA POLYMERASE I [Encephalitozoon cuniculi GB-M1]